LLIKIIAYIISFNLPTEPHIYQYARAKNVTIISQNVIYRLVDEVKSKLSDLLPPKIITTVIGDADIVQIFQINIRGRKYKPVAGCRIKNGAITRNSKIRVIRNKEVVFDGNLDSLKNVKKDVIEMKKGNDCGMGFEGWGGFQEGDQVQCYEIIKEKRYLT
jgi:translation initiation factor IF-2